MENKNQDGWRRTRRENVTGIYDPGRLCTVIVIPMVMMITQIRPVLLRGIRPSSLSSHLHLQPHRQFFTSPPNFSGTMSEFYNLKAKLPGDKEYDFEQLKGKVVLIVNVASKW